MTIRIWSDVYLHGLAGDFERGVVAIRKPRDSVRASGMAVASDAGRAAACHVVFSAGRTDSPTCDNTVSISLGYKRPVAKQTG